MLSTATDTETHKGFEDLCQSLAEGIACEVGSYLIHSVRACSPDRISFDANVTDANGRTFQAQVRLSLTAHENLLGNKVDVSFIGPQINLSLTELTYAVHA